MIPGRPSRQAGSQPASTHMMRTVLMARGPPSALEIRPTALRVVDNACLEGIGPHGSFLPDGAANAANSTATFV